MGEGKKGRRVKMGKQKYSRKKVRKPSEVTQNISVGVTYITISNRQILVKCKDH
jgi:hypothetical protein